MKIFEQEFSVRHHDFGWCERLGASNRRGVQWNRPGALPENDGQAPRPSPSRRNRPRRDDSGRAALPAQSDRARGPTQARTAPQAARRRLSWQGGLLPAESPQSTQSTQLAGWTPRWFCFSVAARARIAAWSRAPGGAGGDSAGRAPGRAAA